MYTGKLAFAQAMEFGPWHTFRRLVTLLSERLAYLTRRNADACRKMDSLKEAALVRIIPANNHVEHANVTDHFLDPLKAIDRDLL